jgi:hypothetical protein
MLELSCLYRVKQAKDLERERAAANDQLTRAILRERISSEEERSKAKLLVSLRIYSRYLADKEIPDVWEKLSLPCQFLGLIVSAEFS